MYLLTIYLLELQILISVSKLLSDGGIGFEEKSWLLLLST